MKKIFLTICIILLLGIMILSLTGCGNNNQEEQGQEVQNQGEVSDQAETVQLNDELSDICGFAQEIENNKYKIVALKTNGESIDITNLEATNYETLDYSGGNIYLQRENNFYSIDLTKGNGNYEVTKVFTYDMDYTTYYKQMGVYNGKIYFTNDKENLLAYDIASGKIEKLIDIEEIFNLYVNKVNAKIYYVERSPKYYLKEYDIATKEIKVIDSASNEVMGSRTYYYNIGISNSNPESIIYSKEEKVGDTRETKHYIYNVENGEKILIDDTFMSGIYVDGKLYYDATSGGDMMYPNYVLKVNSNGTDTVIMEEQENDFIDFYDLGNGKIQAVMNWGQDITTAGEQAYLIDKETLELEKTNQRLDLVYLIQDADSKVLNIKWILQDINFSMDI